MSDVGASIVVAVIEATLAILTALILGVVWCAGLTLFAGGRLGLGVVRVGRRALARRTTERELASIALEYHAAVRDIRHVAAEARHRIRAIGRGFP